MKFRKATMDDWSMLLSWRNDPSTRKNSHSERKVNEHEHKAWLSKVLADPSTNLYVVFDQDVPVGTIRCDKKEDVTLLSWTVAPEARGKGVGKRMVSMMVKELEGKVKAEVKKQNAPSERIAEYAGLSFKQENDGIYIFTNY